MTATLNLMGKQIDLARSTILYNQPLTVEHFARDWQVRNAEWHVREGFLYGRNPLPAPGVVLSRAAYPGNVLIEFYAKTVLPSTHDIDVMWNLSWDESTNTRGVAYVAGIQGWWEGKVGIEKSPHYRLIAAAPCTWFEAGREYFIQAGSIDGHCFVFVDGILRLEMLDPDPIDSSLHNRIGFEAYQSMVRIGGLCVRQIYWQPRQMGYTPEF